MSRETVKLAQRLLNERTGSSLLVDGVIGKNTREALTEYQRSAGLPVSGRADNATLRMLKTPKPTLRENIDKLNETQSSDAGVPQPRLRPGREPSGGKMTGPQGDRWSHDAQQRETQGNALVRSAHEDIAAAKADEQRNLKYIAERDAWRQRGENPHDFPSLDAWTPNWSPSFAQRWGEEPPAPVAREKPPPPPMLPAASFPVAPAAPKADVPAPQYGLPGLEAKPTFGEALAAPLEQLIQLLRGGRSQ